MQIYGHTRQIEFLNHLIKSNIFHHAFAFVGPEFVGKRLVAEAFAQAFILNQNISLEYKKDNNAWRDILLVEHEKEIKKGIEIVKAISIKQIRELKKHTTFKSDAEKRVIIIDNFDNSTISAQNSLLKLLEEPNKGTILILIAVDAQKLLPTIYSRVMRINFNLLSEHQMQNFAECLDDECIEMSMGRPGIIKQLTKDKDLVAKYKEALDNLKNLKNMSLAEKILLAEELSKDLYLLKITLMLWSSKIRNIAQKTKQYKLLLLSEKINNTLWELESSNVNKRLQVENLLLNL